MITFLDKNGDPVDMDDPNAFIASVKVLNEADQIDDRQLHFVFSDADPTISIDTTSLVEAFEQLQEALQKIVNSVVDTVEEVLEDVEFEDDEPEYEVYVIPLYACEYSEEVAWKPP